MSTARRIRLIDSVPRDSDTAPRSGQAAGVNQTRLCMLSMEAGRPDK